MPILGTKDKYIKTPEMQRCNNLISKILPLVLALLFFLPLPDECLAVVFTIGKTVNSVDVTFGGRSVGEEDTTVEVKLWCKCQLLLLVL